MIEKETIIYIRTSTDKQNPSNQLNDCMSLPFKNHIVYKEQQSAWLDKDRPIFSKLKNRIKLRKVEHLIVWDLDRLFRNRKKIIEFFKFCKYYNCKIHSFRQQFFEIFNSFPPPFDEALNDFMLQIVGWMGEDESNKRSDRIKRSVRHGKITKSYKGNRWGRKKIKVDVKRIFDYRNMKVSLREIAAKEKISYGTVNNVLKNHYVKKGIIYRRDTNQEIVVNKSVN